MSCEMFCVFLFFFKQKTAYEMRISDWSSDVCSSDLPMVGEQGIEPVDTLATGIHVARVGDRDNRCRIEGCAARIDEGGDVRDQGADLGGRRVERHVIAVDRVGQRLRLQANRRDDPAAVACVEVAE